MALLVGGDEGVVHLVFDGRGGLEAAAADLRDVGTGLGREDEWLVAGSLVERGVDRVGVSGNGSAAGLIERAGNGAVRNGRARRRGVVAGDEAQDDDGHGDQDEGETDAGAR